MRAGQGRACRRKPSGSARPFEWSENRDRGQRREKIEHPGKLIRAMLVRLKPGLARIVRHGKDAVVTRLAIVHHRPDNCATEQDERESRDLRRPAAKKKRDDQPDDAHC